MECDPAMIQVDVSLKAINDIILQEFNSMRQDFKMEFAQLQQLLPAKQLELAQPCCKLSQFNKSIIERLRMG